jgi:hypothetical protein
MFCNSVATGVVMLMYSSACCQWLFRRHCKRWEDIPTLTLATRTILLDLCTTSTSSCSPKCCPNEWQLGTLPPNAKAPFLALHL